VVDEVVEEEGAVERYEMLSSVAALEFLARPKAEIG
jgi:hypothetical protein